MLIHSRSSFFTSRFFLLALGVVLLVMDQLSKAWVHSHLPLINSIPYVYPYGGIGVFKDFLGIEFSINHMTNSGAAWGLFSQYPYILISLRIGLIIGLLFYLVSFNKESHWKIPFVLIIAGAIGNVCDYFIYGHVIDMFHIVLWNYDFPVFNVADTCISLGMVTLIVLSLFQKNP